MLKLLRQTLAGYQMDMSPIAAPLVFLTALLVARWLMIQLATSQLKNLPSDYRKEVRKHFRERSFIGWICFIVSWAVLILGYFDMIPRPFDGEIYVWGAAGLSLLFSISFHFLAYAQAAIQTIAERKSISLVG